MTVLAWEWSNGSHFAHSDEGVWTIEQKRDKFILTFKAYRAKVRQNLGNFKSPSLAKEGAQRAHGFLERAEQSALKEAQSVAQTGSPMSGIRPPSAAARSILAAKGACRPLDLSNVRGRYSYIRQPRKGTFQPVIRSRTLGDVLPEVARTIWQAAHAVRLRLSTCPIGTEGLIERRGIVIAKWVKSKSGIVAGVPNPFAGLPRAILAAVDSTPEDKTDAVFINVSKAAREAGVVLPAL
jgi:hypothetical protein